jgi:hypothetical protein
MPGLWKSDYRLMLCWFIFMQVLSWTKNPAGNDEIDAHHDHRLAFCRLLKTTYWNVHPLVTGMVHGD